MARCAFINTVTGKVISVTEAAISHDEINHGTDDGNTIAAILSDDAQVGDTWTEKGGFVLKGAAPTLEKFQQALMQEHDFSQDQIDNLTEVAKKI